MATHQFSGRSENVCAVEPASDACVILVLTARVRPGDVQINVETYGGGLWYTWYDRDLGLAGRVLVREEAGGMSHRLVKINRPLLRIPMLVRNTERLGWLDSPEHVCGPLVASQAFRGSHGRCRCGCTVPLVPPQAIHLQRDIHTAGFKPNLQTNFAPVLATAVKAQLLGQPQQQGTAGKHNPQLMALLARWVLAGV